MIQKIHDISLNIFPSFLLIFANLDIAETRTMNKFYSKNKDICILKNM